MRCNKATTKEHFLCLESQRARNRNRKRSGAYDGRSRVRKGSGRVEKREGGVVWSRCGIGETTTPLTPCATPGYPSNDVRHPPVTGSLVSTPTPTVTSLRPPLDSVRPKVG